eukprot:jgi/Mesen1/8842/ME000053S08247
MLLAASSSSISSEDTLTAAESAGIRFTPDVKRALVEGTPVVALESTIVCHGMPYPQNLRTAQEVEAIIRKNGATPATIAIIDGVPHVGAGGARQDGPPGAQGRATRYRQSGGGAIDGSHHGVVHDVLCLQACLTAGPDGAGLAGAGLGDAMAAMDVSSDLTELGRTPVAVVCAGAKSILDIPRTLEYLETQGVTVVAYGCDEFPAFFTRHSGCHAPCRLDTPEACAALLEANGRLELRSGVVIGVPIPNEHVAAAALVESAIASALQEARQQQIAGSRITPFLLKRISELTGGASLEANIALVKNNARVGALIAKALVHPFPQSRL